MKYTYWTWELPSTAEQQRQFYESQTELLKLVDQLMDGASASGPIEAINDLLFHWLTIPIESLLPLVYKIPTI